MRVTGIDSVYYTVADVEACTAFYTSLLGADPQTTWPGRLAEWEFADGNSFGLYAIPNAEKGRNGSAMFAVDDVAQAVADAKSRGVAFEDDGEITDIPSCEMAYGVDPEGNRFILHHRK